MTQFALSVRDYEQSISDSTVKEVERHVRCEVDPEVEKATTAESVPARIVIKLKSGATLTTFVATCLVTVSYSQQAILGASLGSSYNAAQSIFSTNGVTAGPSSFTLSFTSGQVLQFTVVSVQPVDSAEVYTYSLQAPVACPVSAPVNGNVGSCGSTGWLTAGVSCSWGCSIRSISATPPSTSTVRPTWSKASSCRWSLA